MLYEYIGIIIAKVIFEFNDEEGRIEIENIMKRNDVKIDFGHESVEMI